MEGNIRGIPQRKLYCLPIQSNLSNVIFEYSCQIRRLIRAYSVNEGPTYLGAVSVT